MDNSRKKIYGNLLTLSSLHIIIFQTAAIGQSFGHKVIDSFIKKCITDWSVTDLTLDLVGDVEFAYMHRSILKSMYIKKDEQGRWATTVPVITE